MVVVCQLLEPAFASNSEGRPSALKMRMGAGACRNGQAALSLMRHTAAMDRLRQVPWNALRAGVAVPAIASVLEASRLSGSDRVLRRNRGLSRDERPRW